MNDPYKVLGVSPTASDDEIRRAYKELVKKYHPDQYVGNPLSDVAEEKMQQVNEAFDTIMNQRRGGGFGTSSGSSYGYGNNSGSGYGYGSSYTNASYGNYDSAAIRNALQNNNITQAEQMLNAVDNNSRDAEWYFLMGSVCYKRGWLNDAYSNFVYANQMEPTNTEYASAVNQMNRQRGGYMNMGPTPIRQSSNGDMDRACNCCSDLICLDCCCECMGGDLIPCC